MANEFPGVVARAIFVIGGENLIAGFERQGAGDYVDAVGGIGNKDQVVGSGVEISANHLTRSPVESSHLAPQEEHGLAFQSALPGLVDLENRARAGTEGSMVEKNNIRVEQEFGFEIGHIGIIRKFFR